MFTWDMGDQIVALAMEGGKLMRGRIVSLLLSPVIVLES